MLCQFFTLMNVYHGKLFNYETYEKPDSRIDFYADDFRFVR